MNKQPKTAIPLLFEQGHEGKPLIAHFVGIGGIGMSALARWFAAQKWAVSGSDSHASSTTKELAHDGIRAKISHKKSNLPPNTSIVIYSQAIVSRNPELREARRLGIRTYSYPEMVGQLTRLYRTIAVAGSHGKSTTAAILARILIDAKLDPTVIVGTKLKEFGTATLPRNFRNGKGAHLVLEADEYGRAFLHYSPFVLIITNIDREHLDTYKNVENIKDAFLKFISNTKRGGAVILNRDDRNTFSLAANIKKIAVAQNLRVVWFSLKQPEAREIKKIIQIPGKHNIANALGALRGAAALGVPLPRALEAIHEYKGSWRRMEYRGELRMKNNELRIKNNERNERNVKPIVHHSLFKIPVYDDYAHHPSEIKATLRAFREKYPKSRIICVFEPHQAERLKALFDDFTRAFQDAGIVLIFPTYQVAGRDIAHAKYSAAALARAIQKKNKRKLVFYVKNPEHIKHTITALLKPGALDPNCPPPKSPRQSALVIMMGAGNIFEYTKLLLL